MRFAEYQGLRGSQCHQCGVGEAHSKLNAAIWFWKSFWAYFLPTTVVTPPSYLFHLTLIRAPIVQLSQVTPEDGASSLTCPWDSQDEKLGCSHSTLLLPVIQRTQGSPSKILLLQMGPDGPSRYSPFAISSKTLRCYENKPGFSTLAPYLSTRTSNYFHCQSFQKMNSWKSQEGKEVGKKNTWALS